MHILENGCVGVSGRTTFASYVEKGLKEKVQLENKPRQRRIARDERGGARNAYLLKGKIDEANDGGRKRSQDGREGKLEGWRERRTKRKGCALCLREGEWMRMEVTRIEAKMKEEEGYEDKGRGRKSKTRKESVRDLEENV